MKEKEYYNNIKKEIVKRIEDYTSIVDRSKLEIWMIKFNGKYIQGSNNYFWTKKHFAKTALWGMISCCDGMDIINKKMLDELEKEGILEFINLPEILLK